MATRESGAPVAVVGARDLAQQAEFVAQRVLELRDEGTPLSEIGVLYRAHFQALELQIELTRRGIPYEVRSGLRFFEQAHVKDVLAHLRLLVNPKDDVVQAGAEAPAEGGGADGGCPLGSRLRVAEEPLAAFLALELGKAPAGSRAGLLRFRETMKTLKKPSYFSSPAEAIRYVVDDGGYGDVAKGKFPNHSARLDDLEALAQFALAYDDVGRFLEEVTLFGDPVGEDQVAGDDDDRGSSSPPSTRPKGSSGRASSSWACRKTASRTCAPRAPEGLEEERRLFYVAVTRARDELMLVHPLSAYDRYGVVVVTEPSRFLRELPESLYERWVLDETVDAALTPAPDRPRLAADPTLAPDDDDPVN